MDVNIVDQEESQDCLQHLCPPLLTLVNSSFCKPFLHPLSEDFLNKIFPGSVGPSSVKSVVTKKDSSLETVLQQLNLLFEGFSKFYSQTQEPTHDPQFSSEELSSMAEFLKNKIAEMSKYLPSLQSIDDTDLQNLIEIFPNRDPEKLKVSLQEFSSRQKGEVLDVDELIQEILMKGSDESAPAQMARKKEWRIFPFYPEDFNDLGQSQAVHKYRAASQFYKMSSVTNIGIPGMKPIFQPHNAIQSIEYIENETSTTRFDECKRRFNKLLPDGDKEVLLFHGTDVSNIDGIFNNNFNIEMTPTNRPKSMAFGRGIYMSDYPALCLKHGNVLVVCRVLLGRVVRVTGSVSRGPGTGHHNLSPEEDSREVCLGGDGVVTMRVIKTADQVLPYCVINLNKDNLIQTNGGSWRSLVRPFPSPVPARAPGPWPGSSEQAAVAYHPPPSTMAGGQASGSAASSSRNCGINQMVHYRPNHPFNSVRAQALQQSSGPQDLRPLLFWSLKNPSGGPSSPVPSSSAPSAHLAAVWSNSYSAEVKCRQATERRKQRLSKVVKILEEQMSKADISNRYYSKMKQLMETIKAVEKKNIECNDFVQKCERVIKKHLQESQQRKS